MSLLLLLLLLIPLLQVTFYEEERDILAKATSPWMTHLQYAFQVRQQTEYLELHMHSRPCDTQRFTQFIVCNMQYLAVPGCPAAVFGDGLSPWGGPALSTGSL